MAAQKYDPPNAPPPYPQQPPQAHYDAGPVHQPYYSPSPAPQGGAANDYYGNSYGPPQMQYQQQYPPQGYYQQGPPQQGYYPPQGGYHDGRRRGTSGGVLTGLCAGLCASLCCLDLCFFF